MVDTHREPVPGGMGGRSAGSIGAGATTHRRPGMLTFAAVIMFVVAGFEALSALLAFAGTGWWATVEGDLMYANFVFYGILDLIIGLIALYAGIDILRGGTYGLIVGYIFAVVGALRWLFVIPAAPVLAVVVIALCVMVIYGLATHSNYFDETA
jgi:hypothetical protein